MNTKIISTGSYVPELILANEDLHQFPPNRIPLIEQKTGVKMRRHASDTQFTSDLAVGAAKKCLGKIQFDPERVDAIIFMNNAG